MKPNDDSTVAACEHQWEVIGTDRLRCHGPCGVVVVGHLADEPPTAGMDWNRAVLVNPDHLAQNGAAEREAER